MESQYFFKGENITKSFGGLVANDSISFGIEEGEIVGLVGDNAAGKSTLMKQVMGVEQPDKGQFYVDDQEVQINSPSKAKTLGINMIYQDLALFDNLTIEENIFVGEEISRPFYLLKKGEMKKEAHSLLKSIMKENVPEMDQSVKNLSGGQRQEVAIARALLFDVRLLIMDEPTSALSVKESEKVDELVSTLKEDHGISVIYISHNVSEVYDLVDRLIVLSQGEKVADTPKEETTRDEVISLIISGGMKQTAVGNDV